jgi:hypothetical protein
MRPRLQRRNARNRQKKFNLLLKSNNKSKLDFIRGIICLNYILQNILIETSNGRIIF